MFTKLFLRYKNLVWKFGYTFLIFYRTRITNGILHPNLYEDFDYIAQQFRYDPRKHNQVIGAHMIIR